MATIPFKEKLKVLLTLALTQMEEASTVRGVVTVLALVIGYSVKPDRLDAVVGIATALSAVLKILLPDSLKPSTDAAKAYLTGTPDAPHD